VELERVTQSGTPEETIVQPGRGPANRPVSGGKTALVSCAWTWRHIFNVRKQSPRHRTSYEGLRSKQPEREKEDDCRGRARARRYHRAGLCLLWRIVKAIIE